MRIPTVKYLVSRGWEETIAKRVRRALENAKTPSQGLEAVDPIIEGFGVEYIQRGHNEKSPAIEYVNMGDTYAETIMYVNGNYVAGCWGNYVERGRYD